MRLPGEILQGILARAALVLLRVYLGVVFLIAGALKLGGDFSLRLTRFIEGAAIGRSHPFYRGFLQDVVAPNAQLMAALVTWGELLVGVLLILGLLTRLSATVTLIVALNYMLAKGDWPWTPSSREAAFAAISLGLVVGAAGRTLGLDSRLARRWPRSALW